MCQSTDVVVVVKSVESEDRESMISGKYILLCCWFARQELCMCIYVCCIYEIKHKSNLCLVRMRMDCVVNWVELQPNHPTAKRTIFHSLLFPLSLPINDFQFIIIMCDAWTCSIDSNFPQNHETHIYFSAAGLKIMFKMTESKRVPKHTREWKQRRWENEINISTH